MNWVSSKEEGSEQGGLGSVVHNATLVVMGESPDQDGKDVDHEGRNDSMEDDVQYVEANGVEASHQEVVQPERGGGENISGSVCWMTWGESVGDSQHLNKSRCHDLQPLGCVRR